MNAKSIFLAKIMQRNSIDFFLCETIFNVGEFDSNLIKVEKFPQCSVTKFLQMKCLLAGDILEAFSISNFV